MSSPPSSSPQAPSKPTTIDDAAAHRFAELSLKSRPIPEGVDPNTRATLSEAIKTVKPEDVLTLHQTPCAREGLLTGFGSGFAAGFLRYIVGGEFFCVVVLRWEGL